MAHLEVVTPPAFEPVTLAEAKAHCRVEVDDDDAYITSLIAVARLMAETIARETFAATTYDYFLDGFPGFGGGYSSRRIREQGEGPGWLPTSSDAFIRLPRPPLVSVESVKYHDPAGVLTTIDPASYVASAGVGSRIQPLPGYAWPVALDRLDSVVVRYTSGRADAAAVPANARHAILLIVGHLYENREGTTSAAIGMKPIPLGVEALLGVGEGYSYG